MNPRRILYLQFANPAVYPPLEHSSHLLAEAGWQVCFVGTGAPGDADQMRFAPHPNVEVRLRPFRYPGWRQKLGYLTFGLWALWSAWRWRPSWIYASDLFACPVALVLSYFGRFAMLYHEHDSPDERAGAAVSPFIRFLWWTRRRLARRARLCVLPNARRIEAYRQSTGRRGAVACVWNCPRRREVGAPAGEAAHRHPLRLYYHGTLVPLRLPFTVLQAIKDHALSAHLTFIGYEVFGFIGYGQQVLSEAARLGLTGQVHSHGTLSQREELMTACSDVDVGLALMPMRNGDVNETGMAGASNKAFDYLARGTALLVSDLPDWREMFVEPGYGLACNPEDPASIGAALSWFAEHPEETRAMGERGRRRIAEDWNYETQFAAVQSLLDQSFPPNKP